MNEIGNDESSQSDSRIAASKRKWLQDTDRDDSSCPDVDPKAKRGRLSPSSVASVENSSTKHTQPTTLNSLNFYYTKVLKGLDNKFNDYSLTLSIKDILSKRFGQLKESIHFNFIFDVNWLLEQYDDEFRSLPIELIAQDKLETKKQLQEQVQKHSNVKVEFVPILG
jgi:tyrosyl-DNA phosphodiesterase-1